ncbi:MAG: polyketide cyclase [Holophagales bacterium]|nr:polyketide cyclase [Holophagales bacterium]MXX61077.1 polyketide cyclase [Holophagales bacterium]MYC10794.1 polyketide cyclase [Holophagales bacterium]MYD22225.1 polyketide cyclase [Holophagales bacterium]MYI33516.1 polyketide cyclase [Holophagales bacterium]
MGVDVKRQLAAVERAVSSLERDGRPARSVALGRGFPVDLEDLWDAVTNGERIPCWLLPITGDLELGGRYQLEGNAGGVTTACEPPTRYAVTWEFAGDTSWVEVRCAADAEGGARLKLTHTLLHSPHWDQYGPGATGVAWELGLLGLALHLTEPDTPSLDEEAFAASSEGKALITGSAEAWGEAGIAAGEDPDAARAAAGRTAVFYTTQPANTAG